MTTPQLQKLTMYRALDDFLAGQSGILAEVEAIPPIVADFVKYHVAIEQGALKQTNVTAGKTDVKLDAEEKVFASMFLVADSLRAYAKRNNLVETLAKASVERWRLNQLRDSELSTQATAFLDEAVAHSPAVAQYGLTEEVLRKYREAIAAFSKSLETREGSLADRKVTRGELAGLFDATDDLLDFELDAMVEHLREAHPAFYENYHALRSAKSIGPRSRRSSAGSEATAKGNGNGNGGSPVSAPAAQPAVAPVLKE
jgi:hypothetical protein